MECIYIEPFQSRRPHKVTLFVGNLGLSVPRSLRHALWGQWTTHSRPMRPLIFDIFIPLFLPGWVGANRDWQEPAGRLLAELCCQATRQCFSEIPPYQGFQPKESGPHPHCAHAATGDLVEVITRAVLLKTSFSITINTQIISPFIAISSYLSFSLLLYCGQPQLQWRLVNTFFFFFTPGCCLCVLVKWRTGDPLRRELQLLCLRLINF